MPKIIALIDGSAYSESVCDHAAWISNATHDPVEIVHLLGRREVSSNLSGAIGLGARSALMQELADLDAQKAKLAQARGRAILDAATQRLKAAGAQTVIPNLRRADIVESLPTLEEDADVIIVGKRGEAADFASGHLGSNLERVVRASTRPVLVTSRAFKPIQNILIAYDGANSSKRAVQHVAGSQAMAGLNVTLLHVGEPGSDRRAELDAAKETLNAAGFTAEVRIKSGQPDDVILEEAKSGADLLVMGAYGHSRIRSLIIGSTTTQMVRSVLIPVLLFR